MKEIVILWHRIFLLFSVRGTYQNIFFSLRIIAQNKNEPWNACNKTFDNCLLVCWAPPLWEVFAEIFVCLRNELAQKVTFNSQIFPYEPIIFFITSFKFLEIMKSRSKLSNFKTTYLFINIPQKLFSRMSFWVHSLIFLHPT